MENISELLSNIEKKVNSSEGYEKTIILDLLKTIKVVTSELSSLKDSYEELEQYINSIDEDLGEIEAMVNGDEEYEEDSFSEEEFKQEKCLSCCETIYIDKEIYKDRDSFECPNCHNLIKF